MADHVKDEMKQGGAVTGLSLLEQMERFHQIASIGVEDDLKLVLPAFC